MGGKFGSNKHDNETYIIFLLQDYGEVADYQRRGLQLVNQSVIEKSSWCRRSVHTFIKWLIPW